MLLMVGRVERKNSAMGPLRFERRSEDPQSPRMARLPYGPSLILCARITHISSLCEGGTESLSPHILIFLDASCQLLQFAAGDLHSACQRIDLLEELLDAHVHHVHDKQQADDGYRE